MYFFISWYDLIYSDSLEMPVRQDSVSCWQEAPQGARFHPASGSRDTLMRVGISGIRYRDRTVCPACPACPAALGMAGHCGQQGHEEIRLV